MARRSPASRSCAWTRMLVSTNTLSVMKRRPRHTRTAESPAAIEPLQRVPAGRFVLSVVADKLLNFFSDERADGGAPPGGYDLGLLDCLGRKLQRQIPHRH